MDCTPKRTRRPVVDPPSGAVKTFRSRHDAWAALASEAAAGGSEAKKPLRAAVAPGRAESPPSKVRTRSCDEEAAAAGGAAIIEGGAACTTPDPGDGLSERSSEVASLLVVRDSDSDGTGLEFEIGGTIYRVTDPEALAVLTASAAAAAPAAPAAAKPSQKPKRSLDDLRRAQRLRAMQATAAADPGAGSLFAPSGSRSALLRAETTQEAPPPPPLLAGASLAEEMQLMEEVHLN
eukprot:TRINITY_DN16083_c0_g2_i1.p1 TRINITY_DN16083_c0_g2~~TRINITY_DN16083_c0_g2_i1.p1  ORF type:complete len:235 (-),score=53.48 TRINITY_DN16083_c0_g2_i1:65-769(-)